MPRDVSVSDSKWWNDGHEWVKHPGQYRAEGVKGGPQWGPIIPGGVSLSDSQRQYAQSGCIPRNKELFLAI